MLNHRLILTLLLAGASLGSQASIAADWIGKRIIPKSDAVTVRLKDGGTGSVLNIPWPATVKTMDGKWLWVEDDGGNYATAGWVRSSDVLLFNQSISHFNEQLRSGASSPGFYWLRGICWEAAKEYGMAAKDYQAAVDAAPYNADARLGLARTTAKKKYDDAKFVAAWQLNRGAPRMFIDWGDALQADKQPERAHAMYNEAKRLNPNWRMPHYSLAKLAAAQDKYEEAIAGFDEAIRQDSLFHAAFRDRAAALLASSKEKDAAVTALGAANRACELCYYHEADSLAVLAQALAALNNWPDAARYQQMAVEYAPASKKEHHLQQYNKYADKADATLGLVAAADKPQPAPGERPRGVDFGDEPEEVSRGVPKKPARRTLFIDRSSQSFD